VRGLINLQLEFLSGFLDLKMDLKKLSLDPLGAFMYQIKREHPFPGIELSTAHIHFALLHLS
jgi:hypothetical protein